MQLTIEKYTQMVAPLDVRDLDLANAFDTDRLDADVLRCPDSADSTWSRTPADHLPARASTTGANGCTSSPPTTT